ncbi:hypothetical protein RUMOBE_02136 [Blautia obeum ATCC 29174]|uniref:Uncharacterized protein n=1 Tax=Blautia obeum ATCC 29174 TaxID=411459 RepID=A5ZT07_9FIRM|nr:hypothetical protein RUMOBE_02136 [Blautia obeum ATCC 29174]
MGYKMLTRLLLRKETCLWRNKKMENCPECSDMQGNSMF